MQQAMHDLNESTVTMLNSKRVHTSESLSGAEALRSMKSMMMMLKKQATVPLCLAAWTPPSPTVAQGLLSQVRLLTHTPVRVCVCVCVRQQWRKAFSVGSDS